MKDKYIFLDFDGVFFINDVLCEDCVKNLNHIIKETDAKIIISSDWRKHHTLEQLNLFFIHWNIISDISGFTENLFPIGGSLSRIEDYRCNEIEKYIRDNRIENYIIIDDLELYNGYYRKKNDRFFNTLFYKGITNEISESIIKKLIENEE